jgi:hypothetical protein
MNKRVLVELPRERKSLRPTGSVQESYTIDKPYELRILRNRIVRT